MIEIEIAVLCVLMMIMMAVLYYQLVKRGFMPTLIRNYKISPLDQIIFDADDSPVWIWKSDDNNVRAIKEENGQFTLIDSNINDATIYYFHRDNNDRLSQLGLTIYDTPLRLNGFIENKHNIIEILYIRSNRVNLILRHNFENGATRKYFHFDGDKIYLDSYSDDLAEFIIPNYWHW
jgi:hypothetical protein